VIQQLYSVFLFAINSGTSFSEVYGGDKIYWSYKAFFLKGVWQKKRGVTTGGVLGVHQFSYFF